MCVFVIELVERTVEHLQFDSDVSSVCACAQEKCW